MARKALQIEVIVAPKAGLYFNYEKRKSEPDFYRDAKELQDKITKLLAAAEVEHGGIGLKYTMGCEFCNDKEDFGKDYPYCCDAAQKEWVEKNPDKPIPED